MASFVFAFKLKSMYKITKKIFLLNELHVKVKEKHNSRKQTYCMFDINNIMPNYDYEKLTAWENT